MLLGGATYFLEGFDNLTETHLVMMVFDSNIGFPVFFAFCVRNQHFWELTAINSNNWFYFIWPSSVVRDDVQCKCLNNNLWRGHRVP